MRRAPIRCLLIVSIFTCSLNLPAQENSRHCPTDTRSCSFDYADGAIGFVEERGPSHTKSFFSEHTSRIKRAPNDHSCRDNSERYRGRNPASGNHGR